MFFLVLNTYNKVAVVGPVPMTQQSDSIHHIYSMGSAPCLIGQFAQFPRLASSPLRAAELSAAMVLFDTTQCNIPSVFVLHIGFVSHSIIYAVVVHLKSYFPKCD